MRYILIILLLLIVQQQQYNSYKPLPPTQMIYVDRQCIPVDQLRPIRIIEARILTVPGLILPSASSGNTSTAEVGLSY